MLRHALTHRSYAYENGGLPTTSGWSSSATRCWAWSSPTRCYRTHPDLPEGQLAKLRAAVVNARALADVARGLGVGEFLLLGRGEETTGGRDKSSILADAVEALIGAVYLDRGLAEAAAPGPPALRPAHGRGGEPGRRARLEDLACRSSAPAAGAGVPDYVVTETGPDHARSSTALVRVGDDVQGEGVGPLARRRPSSMPPPRPTPALSPSSTARPRR